MKNIALYVAINRLTFAIDAIDCDALVLRDGTMFLWKFSSK